MPSAIPGHVISGYSKVTTSTIRVPRNIVPLILLSKCLSSAVSLTRSPWNSTWVRRVRTAWLVSQPHPPRITLIALEPQLADAQRNSWTRDIRLFKGYDEHDPRPPQYRALDLALEVLKQRGLTDKIALELNMGTQSADRMVGEPTTPTQNYFDSTRAAAGGCPAQFLDT